MPIYAYRCENCGHTQDVLQKISDPTLTVCPSCGQSTFRKQVTAAGFQLKGSGWYVTDFRNGQSGKAPAKDDATKEPVEAAPADAKPDAAKPSSADASSPATTPASAPASTSEGTAPTSKPAPPAQP